MLYSMKTPRDVIYPKARLCVGFINLPIRRDFNMLQMILVKFAFALLTFVLIHACLFGMLKVYDKHLNINFKDTYQCITTSPLAAAIYHGFRLLGMSIVVAITLTMAFVL